MVDLHEMLHVVGVQSLHRHYRSTPMVVGQLHSMDRRYEKPKAHLDEEDLHNKMMMTTMAPK
jgi:hypothetical protein